MPDSAAPRHSKSSRTKTGNHRTTQRAAQAHHDLTTALLIRPGTNFKANNSIGSTTTFSIVFPGPRLMAVVARYDIRSDNAPARRYLRVSATASGETAAELGGTAC